jgi:hypothetical protein
MFNACSAWLMLLTLPSVLAASDASAFEWPDSGKYWRVLVNVNQYAEKYMKGHPDWFARDKLVTDLAVQDVPDRKAAVELYKEVRGFMQGRALSVGTYISGTAVRARAQNTNYPPRNVSTESMPDSTKFAGEWPGHPELQFLDLRDANTRRAFHEQIKGIWQETPAPIRFVDNACIHSSAGKGQPWDAYLKNISEIRELGESLGSRVIFNISMNVNMLSDQEAAQLIEAVGNGNGISLEMPWGRATRASPQASMAAQKRYRQLLDAHIAIVMIPVNTPQDLLVEWVRSWRKATDRLYLAYPFFKQPDMALLAAH